MHTLEEIKAACEACHACPLGETRTNLVFGDGDATARLMFVGEAPGEKEDLSGIPFVGAAGKLLDKFLAEAGIARSDVYIANILKCRPPHNRDPLPAEEDECIGFLRAQVKAIQPKIIVCLGRISANRIIHSEYKITREHGQWEERKGFWLTAVYHPAALLRDPRKSEEMRADFAKIREKLDNL